MALGKTIGEAFTKGLSKVGILYITDPPQWWWDLWENVELFGDPDLRVWVPSTEYSDANHWEREDVQPLKWDGSEDLYVDGHMLYGASVYPHARKLLDMSVLIVIAIIIIAIIVIAGVGYSMRKSGRKTRRK